MSRRRYPLSPLPRLRSGTGSTCTGIRTGEVSDAEVLRAIRSVPQHCSGWSLIAHTAAGTTDTTDVTTSAVDTTGADLLVAAVSVFGNETSGTFSDSKSNSWSPLTVRGSGSNPQTRLYYCQGGSVGAAHTFSWGTFSAFPGLAVAAFSGSAVSPFDAESGGTTASPGSITPAASGELFVACLCWYPGNTVSIDSGFTITDQVNYNGTTMGVALAYLAAGAAAESPTWSASGSFGQTATAMAAFAGTGGGGHGLFLASDLSGLGAGGPFFRNPLG